MIEVQYYNWTN